MNEPVKKMTIGQYLMQTKILVAYFFGPLSFL